MNRWIVVVGAIMIQLALGAIYAWSAFTAPLRGIDGEITSQFAFSSTETQAIFSAGLAAFAIFTIIGGRLQNKYSPRNISLLGGVMLGAGYIIGGMSGANFPMKLIGIGIIGGIGIGLSYVIPISVGVKWFPDKKGLISGLAVAGFGFGAFIWILLANPPSIIETLTGFGGLIQPENGVYTVSNVDGVFKIYGIMFLVLVVLGSLVMIDPPKGYLPEGYEPPVDDSEDTGILKDLGPKKMLKTKQFYLLWIMFVVGALAGLMVIGNIQNFANNPTEGFSGRGFTLEQASDYAVIGAAVFLPIFNGLGRIGWGHVSDIIGSKKSLIMMFGLQALMMFAFYYSTYHQLAFYAVVIAIGFNYGGCFSLFPAATADSFGSKNMGQNYGYVFTSYGVGGIVGPILAGAVQDAGMSFLYAFIPAAILCVVAVVLAIVYTPEVMDRSNN